MQRPTKYIQAFRGRDLEPLGWIVATASGEQVRIVDKLADTSGDVLIAEDGRRFRPTRLGGHEVELIS